MLNQRFTKILDPSNDLLRGKLAIHHDGKIPLHRRKTGQGTGRYLSRSILKQLLEVKFEEQKRRQVGADIRMNLTELSQLATVASERRDPAGMKNLRTLGEPSYLLCQAQQIQNVFDKSFAI